MTSWSSLTTSVPKGTSAATALARMKAWRSQTAVVGLSWYFMNDGLEMTSGPALPEGLRRVSTLKTKPSFVLMESTLIILWQSFTKNSWLLIDLGPVVLHPSCPRGPPVANTNLG